MAVATVEVLYFAGCPNAQTTRALVEDVATELGVTIDLRLSEVESGEIAQVRFLGSPSVRVNGHDVEPGADERDTFIFGCRVYRTEHGLSGQPSREWLKTALAS